MSKNKPDFSPEKLRQDAARLASENAKFFKYLSKCNSRKVDQTFHRLHEEVFTQIDCLACANCCRTLGPRITYADLRRIPRSLKMSPAQFVQQYLRTDEDGDYVFKSEPCPFLEENNYCSIYNDRPRACREYPHTDRQRMYQLLDITLRNTAICPAVYRIVETIKTMKF